MHKYNKEINLMGTRIQLYINHPNGKSLLDDAHKMLIDYDKRFSANSDTSDLNKINHAAGVKPVQVDEDLFELIEIGKVESIASNRALNIAIGPLIQAWRVGFSDARKPKDSEIDELIKIVNPENIILDKGNTSVFLKEKGMKIDLGAIAKGYFADQIMDYFKSNGVESAMINLGGNLLTIGDPPVGREDNMWHVGVQDPDGKRGENALILKSRNQSMVTSGGYERQFTYNGETYHHIFDSNTGYPIKTHIKSITIVSDKSLDGEIWTTRLYAKDPDEAAEIIESSHGIEGVIIDDADRILVTSNLVPYVII